LSVVPRIDSSGVLVLPKMMAPAFSRFCTTGELPDAMLFASAGRPLVFGVPS
tara:strand:- start:396 stop:551 length:156 start_codon:yes stop_codon:yes gene_type:complete